MDNKSSSAANSTGSDAHSLKRRRTERTKRGKPDFYDALEFERQARRVNYLLTRINTP